jgi:hypothetical protein
MRTILSVAFMKNTRKFNQPTSASALKYCFMISSHSQCCADNHLFHFLRARLASPLAILHAHTGCVSSLGKSHPCQPLCGFTYCLHLGSSELVNLLPQSGTRTASSFIGPARSTAVSNQQVKGLSDTKLRIRHPASQNPP